MQNPGRARPQYPIESVDNALHLVRLLGEQETMRVTDVARELGVAVSTAYRLLAMLHYHGFVDQDPATKRYRAGPALLEIGLRVSGRLDLPAIARPHLRALVDEVGETAHLFALEGHRVRFLDSVESPKTVRVSSRTGHTMAAHSTSGGKAMLATLSRAQLYALYPEESIAPVTARSITSRHRLEDVLEAVRRAGYATNLGESEDEVSAVGVALVDRSGRLRGAVSVSAPSQRVVEARLPDLVAAVTRTARAIEAELG